MEPRLFRRPVPMAARFEPEMDDGAQMLRMRHARPISLASVGESKGLFRFHWVTASFSKIPILFSFFRDGRILV